MTSIQKRSFLIHSLKGVLISALLFSLLQSTVNAQEEGISNITYSPGIPSGLDYLGKTVRASVKWDDKNGSNLVFITESEELYRASKNNERDKYLYGYQFVSDGRGWKQLWKIQDYITVCGFDLHVSYIDNSLTVTDLDNDGKGETTFLYLLSCRSDVSPETLKLIMHEGDKKYAIRGETKIYISSTGEKYGGQTVIDKSFDGAPESFLDYAKEQWAKYQTQNY